MDSQPRGLYAPSFISLREYQNIATYLLKTGNIIISQDSVDFVISALMKADWKFKPEQNVNRNWWRNYVGGKALVKLRNKNNKANSYYDMDRIIDPKSVGPLANLFYSEMLEQIKDDRHRQCVDDYIYDVPTEQTAL